MATLKARRNKNYNLYKANVIKKMNMKKVSIKTLDECFENVVTITIGDRQKVNNQIKLNPKIKPTNKTSDKNKGQPAESRDKKP